LLCINLLHTQKVRAGGLGADFSKLFKKYTKEGGDWRCTAATAAKKYKQYELV
jgi:hypothetical protein